MARMIPIEDLLPQDQDGLKPARREPVLRYGPTALSAEELAEILAALPRLLPASRGIIASALRQAHRPRFEAESPETYSSTTDALREVTEEVSAEKPTGGETTSEGKVSAGEAHHLDSVVETQLAPQTGLGASNPSVQVVQTQRTTYRRRSNHAESDILKELEARIVEAYLLVGD